MKRLATGAVLGLLNLGILCAGCEPKPTVFDMAAVDGVHKLLVFPLASEVDPGAGPIVAGMMATHLESARHERFHVLEAPVLWRLTSIGPKSVPDETAARIAKYMHADAALTGSVGYTTKLDKWYLAFPGQPSQDPQMMDRLRDFVWRQGQIEVRVRILSAETGKEIYVHSAKAEGLGDSGVIRSAAEKVLQPLEQYLRSSQSKRKERSNEAK